MTLTDLTGHWAVTDVSAAAAAGWVNGYPDGTFRPDAQVTRAEFLKMLAATKGSASMSDIADQRLSGLYGKLAEQSHWSVTAGYIRQAVAQAVVDPADYSMTFTTAGAVDTWRLEPDKPLTRSEATIMLTRSLGRKYEAERPHLYPGSQWAPAVARPTLTFTDAGQIPAWTHGWVATASKAGLITGYPDGSFRAAGTITRAEAVVMLRRVSAIPAAMPDPILELQPPQTPALQIREGLGVRDFQPVRDLWFEAGDGEETLGVWANLRREYREAVVREKTEQFWNEMKSRGVSPLVLRSVMVNVTGPWAVSLGYATYDGQTFQYFDANGWPGQADPDSSVDLRSRLTALPDRLEAQIAWFKENGQLNLQGAGPVEPLMVYTFPYQYLGDWFQLTDARQEAWGLDAARRYYQSVKPAVEQLGGSLKSVRIVVAPSDTADRLEPYRSLLPGNTLVDNPVLELIYDGEHLTVAKRLRTLQGWLTDLTPTYAQERQGEGSGTPLVDPDRETARRMMETLVYTLGTRPAGQ